MIVLEIIKPGSWIKNDDQVRNFELENLLRQLQDTFYEANIALNLFLNEMEGRNDSITQNFNERGVAIKRKRSIQKEIEARFEANSLPYNFDEIYFLTECEFKREQWKNGKTPQTFKSHLIFIYARTFLFSLDNFDRMLEILSKDKERPDIIKALSIEFKSHFPELREVRNSVHHQEDRIRGLKFKQKIDLKPINNSLIQAPYGGVIMMENLIGNRYGCTLGNGFYGEVEVSIDSLIKIRNIMQSIYNSYNWTGRKEHLPF